ncbi:hypothetical protein FM125_05050 [Micrococcus lylae]|uniref:Uncharacterized protein n=1 Tax=Micrococcus lylae TaxID=1273 RepID=A0A1R4IWQ9_9MICC|nr:hypothetical protein FM125_05050 [Micrococcus lylae]
MSPAVGGGVLGPDLGGGRRAARPPDLVPGLPSELVPRLPNGDPWPT